MKLSTSDIDSILPLALPIDHPIAGKAASFFFSGPTTTAKRLLASVVAASELRKADDARRYADLLRSGKLMDDWIDGQLLLTFGDDPVVTISIKGHTDDENSVTLPRADLARVFDKWAELLDAAA